MQMENRGRGYLHVSLRILPVNGDSGKHADTHQGIGIFNLDTNFCRADLGIEDGANVADDASEDTVRISVEAYVRLLAEMHGWKVILVDVADNPDVREVGDGEGIGGAGEGRSGGGSVGHVLGDDETGGRRIDFDNGSRVIFVDA